MKIKEILPLFLLCALYFLFRSFFWDFIPIWDARHNFLALLQANTQPFDVLNFSVAGHLTQAVFFILSIPYLFIQKNYYMFNIWLSLFGVGSVILFYYLLKQLLLDKGKPFELTLATALFAFHPSILSGMIFFSVDTGLLFFFLFFFLAALHGKRWMMMVSAFLFLFSKETALVLLPLTFLFVSMCRPFSQTFSWVRRHISVLIVPGAACIVFLMYKTIVRGQSPFWDVWHSYQKVDPTALSLWKFLFWHPTPDFFNHVALVFLLNFNWLVVLLWTGLILVDVFCGSKKDKLGWLLLAFFLSSVYFLTLVTGYFSNVRYLMLPITLLLLGTVYWLRVIVVAGYARRIILLVLLVVMLISNFRTFDPLSRGYFGVFKTGTHDMLWITKPTGECCGYGRDQLVYNLEFLYIPRLFQKALEDLKPSGDDIIVVSSRANYEIFTSLNSNTWKATFDSKDAFTPKYMDMNDLWKHLGHLPDTIYYFALPNVDNAQELSALCSLYREKALRMYDIDGYQMHVVRLMHPH